mgnify:CR=1 FL=1
MSLTSLSFVLFLIAVFLLYFLLPKKCQWIVLLVCSLLFYVISGGFGIIYVVITSVTAYFSAVGMQKLTEKRKQYLKENKETLTKEEKKEYKKSVLNKRKLLLIAAILMNVGILVVLKYGHFLVDQANAVLSLFGKLRIDDSFRFLIPLGISFYTLQIIGYLADVYWEKIDAEKNYLKTLLFTSFFPQMVQGPISDYEALSSELFTTHVFTYRNFSRGGQRVVWGFFKKMVIADTLSPYVTAIFSGFQNLSGISCLLGGVLYLVQLYADFSGYMDIMCGFCEMLGIRLSENFDRPFFSKSVSEFWRRWHITLGAWLRKYVYYPVAVAGWNQELSKKSKKIGVYFSRLLPSTVALLFVWFVIGLWHDASWAYIFWGFGNAFFIILSLWIEPLYVKTRTKLKMKDEAFFTRLFRVVRTFLIIMALESIAAVASYGQNGFAFVARIFTEHSIPTSLGSLLPSTGSGNNFARITLALALAGACLMFVFSLIQRRRRRRDLFERVPMVFRVLILSAAIILIITFGVESSWGAGAFMYANF